MNPSLDYEQLGQALLSHARAAIHEALCGASLPCTDHPMLKEKGATFVSLFQKGSLRGCIGTLYAQRLLQEDVRCNALAAAFHDPRFAPLTRREWPEVKIEVSLLSAPQPIAFKSEAELIAALRPFEDGLILEVEKKRATFLPQVWRQIPDAASFLAALKRKAGLDPGRTYPEMRAQRYRVYVWDEEHAAPCRVGKTPC